MTDPTHDDRRPSSPPAEQERLAKLRALGREMHVWHRFDKRLDALHDEAAAMEQRYLAEAQRYRDEIQRLLGEEQRYLRELHEAKGREDALTTALFDTRRIAAERQQQLQAQLENLRLQLHQLLNSRSWKITQPLRVITRWIGRDQDHPASERPQTTEPVVDAAPPVATPGTLEPRQHVIETSSVSAPAVEVVELAVPVQTTEELPVADAPQPAPNAFLNSGKDAWDQAGSSRLQDFLAGNRRLAFPAPPQPAVSIIIALFNKAHLGFLCFESLLEHAGENYELILIDNGSSDDTARLLERIDGAKIIRNHENRGFGYACMQGAERAAGEYLCFLNNDVVLCPGALEAAVANFAEDASVGAVGGKLLLSDGRLQEAGSIVWRDATAWGYGREDDASSPRYAFRRPVDYCSGALLFTPRALFQQLGGFDARFLPAYYEDTDYCFKVWEAGRKVIYEPNAVVHHYESASLQNSEAAQRLIADHRARFAEKWTRQLEGQLPLAGASIPCARIAVRAGGARIIYVGAHIPQRDLGPEAAAASDFLTRLASQGHYVICVSTTEAPPADQHAGLPREIELAAAGSDAHYIFRDLTSQYDAVWIAGAASMREFLGHMWDMAERVPAIIYEPGEIPLADDDAAKGRFDEEVILCQGADIVLVPSEAERLKLQAEFPGRIELHSEETERRLLAEILTTSNPRR